MNYPLDNQERGSIENAKFKQLQAFQFKGGLPIFTAVPTYQGTNGEIVIVKTGTNPSEVYALYIYIENNASPKVFGWHKIV